MDKAFNAKESIKLVTLTSDEIIDVQGGDKEKIFEVFKTIINGLIKIENQP